MFPLYGIDVVVPYFVNHSKRRVNIHRLMPVAIDFIQAQQKTGPFRGPFRVASDPACYRVKCQAYGQSGAVTGT